MSNLPPLLKLYPGLFTQNQIKTFRGWSLTLRVANIQLSKWISKVIHAWRSVFSVLDLENLVGFDKSKSFQQFPNPKSNHFVKNLKISNQIKWKKSQIQINSKLIWFLANPNHPNQILFKIMKPIKKKPVYSGFFTQLVNCHCTKLFILVFLISCILQHFTI